MSEREVKRQKARERRRESVSEREGKREREQYYARNKERGDLLQPLLDVVQHGHGHRVDHGHLASVVLEDEHHVKVLQLELHALKVHQLHVLQ